MSQKRKFPDDWSDFSKEQTLECVKFLLANYTKYKISVLGPGHVLLDNVDIRKQEQKILDYDFMTYIVNNRSFTVDSEVGFCLSRLVYLCEQEKSKKSGIEKIKKFFNSNTHDTAFVATLIGISVLCATAIYTSDKITQEQQKQQKQFEKMLDKRIQDAIKKQEIIKQDSLQKIY